MLRVSLRLRLALFWFFTLSVAIALACLLYQIYRQGSRAQISHGKEVSRNACSEIQRKFSWGVRNHSFEKTKETQFQNALLEIILEHYSGSEGGFWNKKDGFVGYAFPTYEGSSTKTDVPGAEKNWLAQLSEQGLKELNTDFRRGTREAIVVSTCPIADANEPTAAWVMVRIPVSSGIAFEHFSWAIGLLLFYVICTGIGASWMLMVWSKDLRQLESAIKNYSLDDFPKLDASREPDLQSIVVAFNELNARFKSAQDKSAELDRRLAQADRLSMLGKMAAGVAHEIRNPMATARLKFENALTAPAERIPLAAPLILEQMARVDRLVQMLLAMTQPFELRPEKVDIASWLQNSFLAIQHSAKEQNVDFRFGSKVKLWSFDAFHMARAITNILLNSLAHTPAGGRIELNIEERDSKLFFDIKDSGPGIKDEMRSTLFEPFVTGRPDGVGLGLLLVKEITEAHGGHVTEIGGEDGAHFQLEIPWLKS